MYGDKDVGGEGSLMSKAKKFEKLQFPLMNLKKGGTNSAVTKGDE